ncbi:hypothetical protein ACLOJK_036863 [Asimina triloba]
MLRQGCAAAAAAAAASTNFVRHFSRKVQPNLRRINPKVPPQEAHSIANSLYHIIKHHGAVTVSTTWNFAKDAGIDGLNSKTHMKTMLKWMRGRKMLKLFCTHVGSSKSFLHTTLPEDPLSAQKENPLTIVPVAAKPSVKKKKPSKKPSK